MLPGKNTIGVVLLIFFLGLTCAICQTPRELRLQWQKVSADSNYRQSLSSIRLLNRLSEVYLFQSPDSALMYANHALMLSERQQSKQGEVASLLNIAKAFYLKGAYDRTVGVSLRVLRYDKKYRSLSQTAAALNNIGLIYITQENYTAAISEFRKSAKLSKRAGNAKIQASSYFNLGLCYDETGRSDSALLYLKISEKMAEKANDEDLLAMVSNRLGALYFHMHDVGKAKESYEHVLKSKANNWERSFANTGLAEIYYIKNEYKKAIYFAGEGLKLAERLDVKWDAAQACRILSEAYAAVGDFRSAYQYGGRFKVYDDSLFSTSKDKEINNLHLQQKMLENQQLARENKLKQKEIMVNRLVILLIGMIAFFMVVLILLIYRSNRHQYFLNIKLQKKNRDIACQKDRIEQQNKELSRLNYTKDQLFSIISHDLRGPLHSIQQATELLCEGSFTEEEQKILFDGFYREIAIVNNMMNNMLHWASSQQRGIRVQPQHINLVTLVNELVEVHELLARNKGITIKKELPKELWIDADPDQIKVIIQNLLGNAIKFTPAGGSIYVTYSDDNNSHCLHFRDTGVGITREKMDRLFKAVGKTISTPGTNSETGTGLGLVLVKDFVEANKGKISVNSSYGEGTEFVISFIKSSQYHLSD